MQMRVCGLSDASCKRTKPLSKFLQTCLNKVGEILCPYWRQSCHLSLCLGIGSRGLTLNPKSWLPFLPRHLATRNQAKHSMVQVQLQPELALGDLSWIDYSPRITLWIMMTSKHTANVVPESVFACLSFCLSHMCFQVCAHSLHNVETCSLVCVFYWADLLSWGIFVSFSRIVIEYQTPKFLRILAIGCLAFCERPF